MLDATRNSDTSQMLASYVERLARLEIEKKAIADDIKEVYSEAKALGFDKKAIAEIVREEVNPRKKRERIEHEAITELYRASLGHLGGTPLGDAARRRYMPKPEPEEAGEEQDTQPETDSQIGPEEVAAARETGRDDQKAGKKITENPYISGDPRRAAWDEGWCMAAGSDGMDIPEALRRKRKKKGEDTGEGGEG